MLKKFTFVFSRNINLFNYFRSTSRKYLVIHPKIEGLPKSLVLCKNFMSITYNFFKNYLDRTKWNEGNKLLKFFKKLYFSAILKFSTNKVLMIEYLVMLE